jgi:hypothetical protein
MPIMFFEVRILLPIQFAHTQELVDVTDFFLA